jgi:hypothetical protein
MNVMEKIFSVYYRSKPYLLVKKQCLKKLKDSLKIQLSRRNSYISIEIMIDKVNTLLRGALNYYNLTRTTKKQLLPLNNLLHKLFYKYLLRKFSSTPKIYTFIKTNFTNQNRFIAKNKSLLKVSDINPFKSVPLVFIAPTNKFLMANVYINQNIIDKKNRK